MKKHNLQQEKSKSNVMKPWGENYDAVPQWRPADLRVHQNLEAVPRSFGLRWGDFFRWEKGKVET